MDNKNVLTVEQVAMILGRDRQTIRYLIDNGLVGYGISWLRKGNKRKTYLIYKDKFMQETGVQI